MKNLLLIPFVLLCFGCSTPSKYAHDPRAFLVGPDYLDYIDAYPPDRDTQYYYPEFAVGGARGRVAETPLPTPAPDPRVAALLTRLPQPQESAKAVSGKGWPCLEQAGIPWSATPH